MARVSIEDCLEHVENRFALVSIAAHRARQLMDGEDSFVRSRNKEAVTALREIADGYIVAQEAQEEPAAEEVVAAEEVKQPEPTPPTEPPPSIDSLL